MNGIDRKKNYDCYRKENCVSCCEICNLMKRDYFDEDEFVDACQHILVNLNIIGGKLHPELFVDFTSSDYNGYINRAKSINVDFKLKSSEFYQISNENCYLCGKENTETHNNGIDRIDSNKGYFLENCKSCCGTCNYIKNDYELYNII